MHTTILVPAYNVASYINLCFDSLLRQTYQDYDILVVNDGSTDSTQQVIDRYLRMNSKFSCLSLPKNQGVAGATKIGIEMAQGPVVTIVDSDDTITPNALSTVVPLFHHKFDFVWSQFDIQGRGMGWSKPLPPNKTLWQSMMHGGWWNAAHHKFFTKDAYRRTPGINPEFRIASDFQLVLLLASIECKAHHLPVVTYHYTRHRVGSITVAQGPTRQREETIKIREWVKAQKESKALA